MKFLEELEWRGLLHTVSEGARDALRNQVTGYIGFDPTAPSLHVGSLLPLLALLRLRESGHSPIAVIGGGTGLVGDPSGKTSERPLLDEQTLEANVASLSAQVRSFLGSHNVTIVNNADWLAKMTLPEFLRDYGKHFNITVMLARDSVRRRLDNLDGLSFTEFSYMVLQAIDFLILSDRFGCTLQMGGSDQWGNIVAGIELIRKLRQSSAFGIVLPLATTASGAKFGKSEVGTIWLDPSMTSPYRFYQFWLATDDNDVERYLKFFTLMNREQIDEVMTSSKTGDPRSAQRTLARSVSRFVHGDTGVSAAERASAILFGADFSSISASELEDIFHDVPAAVIAKEELDAGIALQHLLAHVGLSSSKREAARLIEQGGVYVNNRRVSDVTARLNTSDAVEGRIVLLKRGQRDYCILRVR